MKKPLCLVFSALVLLSSLAASQSNAAIEVTLAGRLAGSATTGGSSPGGAPNASGGGQFNWTVDSNPSNFMFRAADGSFSTTNFISYCIEISELINVGSTHTFDVILVRDAPLAGTPPFTPIGSLNEHRLGRLWANYLPGGLTTGVANTNANRAAFQVAIWALVYQEYPMLGAPDLENGDLTIPASAIRNTAQAWLDAVSDDTIAMPKANLMALSIVGVQDQLVEVVPEPASIAVWSVLAGGAAGLSLAKRRRRRVANGRWDDETRSAIFAVVENGKAHH